MCRNPPKNNALLGKTFFSVHIANVFYMSTLYITCFMYNVAVFYRLVDIVYDIVYV